ncbi:MAG: VWA domain-containing protein [Alphaproteobacteria bacterium]
MIDLANPLILIVLPLPFIIRFFSKYPNNINGEPLITPFFDDVKKITPSLRLSFLNTRKIIRFLAFIAWIFLVIAAARPRWVGEPVPVEIKRRELLLAIDVSGSMRIADFTFNRTPVSRMTAVREIASDFIKKRCGDKLGLIFFGTKAYLRSPPSFDCQTVYDFMKDAEIGVAGTNTAIGDAVAMAVKYTKDNENNKVLILLTDGANNSGYATPDEALNLAISEGLKIYTIGIGSKQEWQENLFGFQFRDNTNDIDIDFLTNLAKKTGGKFYLAQNLNELSRIYNEIDKLEPISNSKNTIKPIKELFYLPLAVTLTLSFIILAFLCSQSFSKTGRKD